MTLVALTGRGKPDDERLARQAGFDDHWTKPVDPATLATRLSAAIARAAATSDRDFKVWQ